MVSEGQLGAELLCKVRIDRQYHATALVAFLYFLVLCRRRKGWKGHVFCSLLHKIRTKEAKSHAQICSAKSGLLTNPSVYNWAWIMMNSLLSLLRCYNLHALSAAFSLPLLTLAKRDPAEWCISLNSISDTSQNFLKMCEKVLILLGCFHYSQIYINYS